MGESSPLLTLSVLMGESTYGHQPHAISTPDRFLDYPKWVPADFDPLPVGKTRVKIRGERPEHTGGVNLHI